MKTEKKSRNSVNTLEHLKSTLNLVQKLDLQSMNKIRGGDGDDNGGEDIIIPIPIPKSTPDTTTNTKTGTNSH